MIAPRAICISSAWAARLLANIKLRTAETVDCNSQEQRETENILARL